jgi:hypothetical protein
MLSVTPIDYEPAGFYAVENSAFIFPSEALNCKLGEVMTPFHTLKFNVKMETKKLDSLKKDKTGSHKVEDEDPRKKTVTRSAREVQVYFSVYRYIMFCFCSCLFICSFNNSSCWIGGIPALIRFIRYK